MRTAAALPAAAKAKPLSPDDEAMLDGLRRAAFSYFIEHGNCINGLVADTYRVFLSCAAGARHGCRGLFALIVIITQLGWI